MMSTEQSSSRKWPKTLPQLTEEQERIRNEFMTIWHKELPRKYGVVERFNHGYPCDRKNSAGKAWLRTLEIGAGLGEHIAWEDLSDQEYHAIELRPEMAQEIHERFPDVEVAVGDCQGELPYEDGFFDRVLAIHVLEHLPNLPAALKEIYRVLSDQGQFCVVIPCESGALYSLCRNISARRLFERRFKMSYDWFVASEHINMPWEITEELDRLFQASHTRYFPFLIPWYQANVCIGITLSKRQD